MTATSKILCTHHGGKLATVSLGFKSDQSHDLRNDSEVASVGGLYMEGTTVPFLVRLPSLTRGGVAETAATLLTQPGFIEGSFGHRMLIALVQNCATDSTRGGYSLSALTVRKVWVILSAEHVEICRMPNAER